ncbi:hypothetical protein [Brevibacillus porteri]|nr:hypothetical protein [Brevibacillus porteri]MED2129766.1 hypothetical protein [Brevibacillus porteri]MED2893936.1 hypothetical protein [Brevibacillus porteri]
MPNITQPSWGCQPTKKEGGNIPMVIVSIFAVGIFLYLIYALLHVEEL